MNTVKKQLLEILGENGEHWCKDESAMDKDGNYVDVFSPNAHRFCLSGAVDRLYGEDNTHTSNPVMIELGGHVKDISNFNYVTEFNDSPHTTFGDVKKLMDLIEE